MDGVGRFDPRYQVRINLAPRRAERFNPKALGLQLSRPAFRVEARLVDQLAHELARIVELSPDARQEQGAPRADAKNKAVAVGLERAGEFGFAMRRNWARMREDRHVEMEAVELGLGNWREARIGKARLNGVHRRVFEKPAARVKRTDA